MITDVGGFFRLAQNLGFSLPGCGILLWILGIILDKIPLLGCVSGTFEAVLTNWAIKIAGLGLIMLVFVWGLAHLGSTGSP